MRVDRGRRVYVHEADKESKDEVEGRKWTGGLYTVGKEWTGALYLVGEEWTGGKL